MGDTKLFTLSWRVTINTGILKALRNSSVKEIYTTQWSPESVSQNIKYTVPFLFFFIVSLGMGV